MVGSKSEKSVMLEETDERRDELVVASLEQYTAKDISLDVKLATPFLLMCCTMSMGWDE